MPFQPSMASQYNLFIEAEGDGDVIIFTIWNYAQYTVSNNEIIELDIE